MIWTQQMDKLKMKKDDYIEVKNYNFLLIEIKRGSIEEMHDLCSARVCCLGFSIICVYKW